MELKDGTELAEISRKGCAIHLYNTVRTVARTGSKVLPRVVYDRGVLGHLDVNEWSLGEDYIDFVEQVQGSSGDNKV